ncbi:MAG TPA: class I SAM-dependent methyltransferase [Terriglobia bacterium]|nr:class I SAM-dependent methyltransferase [Terriglobia bacterium]
MKRCLSCQADYQAEDWRCPSCGTRPQQLDGVLAFAPDLARSNTGMAPDAHHALEQMQDRSFWFRSRNRIIFDLVRRYFAKSTSVMEIGCGTGYVLAALARALPKARMTGSEIYTTGLDYAARRLQNRAVLFQMDAQHLPFTGEFDLIAACDVLEHIEDDRLVLKEIYRALRPGGGLLLTVPQHPSLWSASDDFACHKRRYRRSELGDKVREAGFAILRDTSFVTTLLPLLLLQRLTSGQKKDYDADAEFALPGWLDRLLEGAVGIDRAMINLGLSLPVGGSRLVLAERFR